MDHTYAQDLAWNFVEADSNWKRNKIVKPLIGQHHDYVKPFEQALEGLDHHAMLAWLDIQAMHAA